MAMYPHDVRCMQRCSLESLHNGNVTGICQQRAKVRVNHFSKDVEVMAEPRCPVSSDLLLKLSSRSLEIERFCLHVFIQTN